MKILKGILAVCGVVAILDMFVPGFHIFRTPWLYQPPASSNPPWTEDTLHPFPETFCSDKSKCCISDIYIVGYELAHKTSMKEMRAAYAGTACNDIKTVEQAYAMLKQNMAMTLWNANVLWSAGTAIPDDLFKAINVDACGVKLEIIDCPACKAEK